MVSPIAIDHREVIEARMTRHKFIRQRSHDAKTYRKQRKEVLDLIRIAFSMFLHRTTKYFVINYEIRNEKAKRKEVIRSHDRRRQRELT